MIVAFLSSKLSFWVRVRPCRSLRCGATGTLACAVEHERQNQAFILGDSKHQKSEKKCLEWAIATRASYREEFEPSNNYLLRGAERWTQCKAHSSKASRRCRNLRKVEWRLRISEYYMNRTKSNKRSREARLGLAGSTGKRSMWDERWFVETQMGLIIDWNKRGACH